MIYGMYLSATGVMTSAYRQDVISNNLANSQTSGFKRELATFEQRRPASLEHPNAARNGSALLARIGGGTLALPTQVDASEGTVEATGAGLDAAIIGRGFFNVQGRDGKAYLTRSGHFQIDRAGLLRMENEQQSLVLDAKQKPIVLDTQAQNSILKDGTITQNGQAVARLGFSDVDDARELVNRGASLMSAPAEHIHAAETDLQGGAIEGSNVDPAVELASLMDTQRQLEANANMIRYQDQTLDKLVNEVGKVS